MVMTTRLISEYAVRSHGAKLRSPECMSTCTLEFANLDSVYKWLVQNMGWHRKSIGTRKWLAQRLGWHQNTVCTNAKFVQKNLWY